MARARLYVHGVPGIYVDVTTTENWDEVQKLRAAWGLHQPIYMWADSPAKGTQWRLAMDWSWQYAEPPADIALANYLLEGA